MILKPSPDNIQELYLESLRRLASIRFSTTPVRRDKLGSSDAGRMGSAGKYGSTEWRLHNLLISSRSAALTRIRYRSRLLRAERLASYIQEKENVFDLEWVDGVTYGDVFTSRNTSIRNIRLKWPTRRCCSRYSRCMSRKRNRAMEQLSRLPGLRYVLNARTRSICWMPAEPSA